MTIAACHVSPEGVVLGADSATTSQGPRGVCHLDYAQKVFEVGPSPSSMGVVTWGLGQIGNQSHRSIVAELGAAHHAKPFTGMDLMAEALAESLWAKFTASYAKDVDRFKVLKAKVEATDEAEKATEDERDEYDTLFLNGLGGYCLAGRIGPHGPCQAFEILWGLHLDTPNIRELRQEYPIFWGVTHVVERLVFGIDSLVIADIMASKKWNGTKDELLAVAYQNQLITPVLLPIREAIDWVHTVIHTTIRGTKFAKWPHFCGGPVEIAAITTDRAFRWVRHKRLDAAIITAEEAGQ